MTDDDMDSNVPPQNRPAQDPVKAAFAAAEAVEPMADDARSDGAVDDVDGAAPDLPDGSGPDPAPRDMDALTEAQLQAVYECTSLPLNDHGNGLRFARHFGEDVMYVPRVGWFVWDGMRWIKDVDMLRVRTRAQAIAPMIEAEVNFIQPTKKDQVQIERRQRLLKEEAEIYAKGSSAQTDEDRTRLGQISADLAGIAAVLKTHTSTIGRRITHAKNAGNNGPIDHMMTESTTSLARDYDDLDKGALDICTLDGVVRFRRDDMRDSGGGIVASYDLLPHARGDLITKIMPVRMAEGSKCPRFDEFMAEIQPDRAVRDFIQRWLGLSMTGLPHQGMAFYHGGGANGKSVLVDLMARIMAEYAASIRIESLTGTNRRSGSDATPDLIPLMGARMVRTSEPDQGEKLQEGTVKQITGGEPILIRPNYGEFIEITPFFKLTMSGNHKPDIRGTDDGIWRRVMLVPFEVTIPEDRRDKDLGHKLWAERDGIFQWLIDGLLDYLEGGLRPPDVILRATQEYREQSDPLGQFLSSCFTITGDPSDSILTKDMGDAFTYHMMENNQTPWKPSSFTRQLVVRVESHRDPVTGMRAQKSKASLSQYTGLRFTDSFSKRFLSAKRDPQGRPIGVGGIDADGV